MQKRKQKKELLEDFNKNIIQVLYICEIMQKTQN